MTGVHQSVRVIYNSAGKITPQQVDVTRVEVKAYGSGAVKADELLSSLHEDVEESKALLNSNQLLSVEHAV